MDYDEAIFLWRVDKKDFLLWTITSITTLFLGIEIGVLVGVIIQITVPWTAELFLVLRSVFFLEQELVLLSLLLRHKWCQLHVIFWLFIPTGILSPEGWPQWDNLNYGVALKCYFSCFMFRWRGLFLLMSKFSGLWLNSYSMLFYTLIRFSFFIKNLSGSLNDLASFGTTEGRFGWTWESDFICHTPFRLKVFHIKSIFWLWGMKTIVLVHNINR